jgi:SAM-dependent methyltransferase
MRNLILKKEDLFEAKYEEAFDAIDAYGVIHHTVSPKRSVEILLRALRNGGVLRLMVYSKDARSEIEDLRKEVQSLGIKDLARVKEIVGEKGTRLLGDLSEPSGMADALLNPIAHTFTRETLDELLQSFLNLEVLKIEAGGNFVVHARKRS